MIKKGVRKAQFEMSFSMIFSIILIAVFLVVAFIAINAFLGVRCSTEQGKFMQDLQSEVTRIWKGAGEDKTIEFKINGCDFTQVCFYDPNEDVTNGMEIFARDFRENIDE